MTWTSLPAVVALVVLLSAGIYADHQNSIVAEQALRVDVAKEMNLVRANLEGNVNGDLQLTRGLIATIVTEPNMSQTRFAKLAKSLFREKTQVRNIAAAPGLVISLMYPMEGNEKAVGLDFRKDEELREAALRARDTKQLVLAGPVELKQGGQAFIGRFPVFLDPDRPTETFWGIMAAVIDIQKLYEDSGLLDKRLSIEIALTGKDALGRSGARFFGPARVAEDNPVTAEVRLPTGSWQISAVPKGGWNATPRNAWILRLAMLIGGALVVVPIVIAGRLFEQRHKHYADLRRSERRLAQLSERLELALDASQIGVWEQDLDADIIYWDDRLNEIYGKPADGKLRTFEEWSRSIHPDDCEQAKRDFAQGIATGIYSSEYRVMLPNGAIRHLRARAKSYKDGTDHKMVGAEWDVTADVALTLELERAKNLAETKNAELEAATARNEHTALHDSLTGLPNRRHLDTVLDRQAATVSTAGSGAALLHLDLDRFKQINDTLGHAVGDAVLIHTAKVLTSTVGSADFVARVGGDEFVVVCSRDISMEQLKQLANRIIQRLRQPVPYNDHQCRIGVSIGIAVDGGRPIDGPRLMVNADIALYRAKGRGRNRYEFFTEDLQSEIVRTKRVADEILGGLERNEFVPHYQLQFDAKTLEVAGVEALARWNHPIDGLQLPGKFLKIAEELNVVSVIDRLMLKQTLHDFDQWQKARLLVPHVSVNVSARRLQDEELINSLTSLSIKPGTVSFELLESIFLDDNDELMVWNVNQIKELGIDIEIDDFGTGHASIVSLLKLQPRRLKIARQLISPIAESVQQREVVESIVQIGRSLGVEVIAEGVETMLQTKILKDLGCDILQGYALSRPMSAYKIMEFLGSRRMRSAS
ncbi:EAL domain-containing protein [Mesorhizobium sp. B292B1B]|uniref:bifunctional diguanylate cyclase/phosphodiesterase n=1 Tax=unclassified Mesorhizobium TaxID=325217 RepID=UPI00112C4F2E|nr:MULTISPECIES: EAL domain-containing protein [unclassified Mesorhizobium]MCA0012154.1 EAL domain-containing protein [Mesorhizobium sp. B294B1A1]MCA0038408.1 EAL domain-containing protein [Mesorhizobium sp. B292B1B]TPM41244.1 EAL domain-containing protein [Mesorhizobium sp. B2-3-2]